MKSVPYSVRNLMVPHGVLELEFCALKERGNREAAWKREECWDAD